MAKNEVFREGEGLSLPAPTGTVEGTPLRIGILNAVTQTAEGSVKDPTYGLELGSLSGNLPGFASVKTNGVWNLSVESTAAVAVGDPIYIKSDSTLTHEATGNFLFGVALRTKGTGTGNVLVKILQPGQIAASA